MKMTKQILIAILFSIILQNGIAQSCSTCPKDNPIASFYMNSQYSGEGYPGWTDDIRWDNVINIKTFDFSACASCTNDFAKFEYVRDILYAQGGGVIYYPAGTYDFSNHPTDPMGRGVMLKKGVVIRGEQPTTKVWAINNWNDATDESGLESLQTIFVFPTWDKKTNPQGEFVVRAGNGIVPRTWNHIGLMPVKTNGESIKDVNYVGICWVKVKFATVYFGSDFNWANITKTWATSGAWKSTSAKTTNEYGHDWSSRISDGTHPFDVYTGSPAEGPYVHGSKCRFVFGCRFENSVMHDDIWKHGYNASTSNYGYFGSRFLGRVVVDGEHIFVANNIIPKPTECFYFDATIKLIDGTKVVKTILYDYARSIGFDINKSLTGQRGNRCILTGENKGAYYSDNILLQDNYTYQHGNKGFEAAGKWSMFKRNMRHGNKLLAYYDTQTSDDVYGLGKAVNGGKGWINSLNGDVECKPTDDNMSRGMDIGGWNLWIDGNYTGGQGSWPGNDGEGILWQRMNAIEVFSVGITNNKQAAPGSYVYPYDCHVIGMFQGWNNQYFSVGNYCKVGDRQEDFSVVGNLSVGYSKCTSGDVQDEMLDADCSGPADGVPSNLLVLYDSKNKCNIISWKDNATNEIAFEVQRRVVGNVNWTTISIRPRNESGGISGPGNITGWIYPGGDLGGNIAICANQFLDINAQVWYDYNLAKGVNYEYRIIALGCDVVSGQPSSIDRSISTTPVGPIVNVDFYKDDENLLVYPIPANEELNIRLENLYYGNLFIRIYDLSGKLVKNEVVNKQNDSMFTKINLNGLISTNYLLVIEGNHFKKSVNFIKF